MPHDNMPSDDSAIPATPAVDPTVELVAIDPDRQAHIAELLTILASIPTDVLPDGEDLDGFARIALQMDIEDGYVLDLYPRMITGEWIVEWADVAPDEDPRELLSHLIARESPGESSMLTVGGEGGADA